MKKRRYINVPEEFANISSGLSKLKGYKTREEYLTHLAEKLSEEITNLPKKDTKIKKKNDNWFKL